MYETLNSTVFDAAYLPVLIALAAFVESFAFVGLLIPGVAILIALTALAGDQQLSVATILLAGFCGAVLGDGLSFWLGRHFSQPLLKRWPLKHHHDWVNQGRVFFYRYGMVSVMIGRFIGPVRPVVPFSAGMMGMSSGVFIACNLLSALVWAPAYLLPGYFLGQAGWALISQWGWLVVAAALAGSLIYWLRRR